MTVAIEHSLSLSQRLSDQFYRFERRGRGWQVWDAPVDLEPPFVPFWGHYTDDTLPDDGRKQTRLSTLFGGLRSLVTGSTSPAYAPKIEEEPEAREARHGNGRVEFQIMLPSESNGTCQTFEALLLSLSFCRFSLSFELVGDSQHIRMLIGADEVDAPQVEDQLVARFPDAILNRAEGILEEAWSGAQGEPLVVDFGLSREFMLPIATHKKLKTDPFLGITGALSRLAEGELAVFQVLFSPVKNCSSQSTLERFLCRTAVHFSMMPLNSSNWLRRR